MEVMRLVFFQKILRTIRSQQIEASPLLHFLIHVFSVELPEPAGIAPNPLLVGLR
jgi:hypothetical protein